MEFQNLDIIFRNFSNLNQYEDFLHTFTKKTDAFPFWF